MLYNQKGIQNNYKTLIDNIYSNVITPNNILGNLTAIISDHLPRFLIAPELPICGLEEFN